jgi:hypothetical protein
MLHNVAEERPSTFKQNRYIYHYLGLDIRDCDPSLSVKDAGDLIKQMKSDPKFVYDYLVENKAKIVDSSKLVKLTSKKEISMKSIKTKAKIKTKTEMCRDLYLKNKNITNKEIAEQVGCHNAVVSRAISSLKLTKKKRESRLSLKNLGGYINKNFSNKDFSVEQLALSYNTTHNTEFTINQFNDSLKKMMKNNSVSKTEKLYSTHTNGNKKVVSACASNFILKRINSKKLKFYLDDVSKEYPDVDSKKIKKAIQNWSYSEKLIHDHLIQSHGNGKYVLVNSEHSPIPAIVSSPRINTDNTGKALEIANSLYKMVGMQNAIKFLKLIESLKNE